MRYFQINPLGDDQDKKLAFIDNKPKGMGLAGYKIATGERIGENYPDDAKTKLDTYFAPFNRDLHAILRQHVDEPTFPSWICGATNEADSNSNAKSQITAYRSGLSCE